MLFDRSNYSKHKKDLLNIKPSRLNISDEAIVKITVVVICIIFFIFISFFYPNLTAWQGKTPISSINSNYLLNELNNNYYRVGYIELSHDTSNTLNISEFRVFTLDRNSREMTLYNVPLDTNVKVLENNYKISQVYSNRPNNYLGDILEDMKIRLDYMIVLNSDLKKELLNMFSVNSGSNDLTMELLKSIQSDHLIFFKQSDVSKWYTKIQTNFGAERFSSFISDIRNSKPLITKTFRTSNLKDNILVDPSILKEQLRVEVSNSTNLSGLAGEYSKVFENLGLTISKVSNFDFVSPKNVIILSQELENTVTFKTIKKIVGDEEVIFEKPTKFSTADILVVVTK